MVKGQDDACLTVRQNDQRMTVRQHDQAEEITGKYDYKGDREIEDPGFDRGTVNSG